MNALTVAERGHDLAGFCIGVTGDRRGDEVTASFERRGATVLRAPVLRIIPLEQDHELVATTRALLADPPDDVVVTTAIGFRGWIEAADAAGLAPQLLDVLSRAKLWARGPKAKGAIRAAGLVETWSAVSETTVEVVDHLVAHGVAGRRVAVQLHGITDEELMARLPAAGATVHRVPVYRWGPSPDPASVQRLIDAICVRAVDVVMFTSAPGSDEFLRAVERAGRLDDVLGALRGDVTAAAVGDVTAGPLRAVGLDPVVPDRFRLGALIRAVGEHCLHRRVVVVETVAGTLQLRGQAAGLDGALVPLTPAPRAMLRALLRRPGHVVDRAALRGELPGAGDLHAVEVAVARLRSALGRPEVVETVVKRGYRLAVGPSAG